MRIVELKIDEFDEYSKNHPLGNYCQTSQFAKVMGELGFSYDYIAMIDSTKEIVAASLILYKKIGMFFKYAYAPRGFLIDYQDEELTKTFIKLLSNYYKKRGYVLLKINPEVIIGNLNNQTLQINNTENNYLIDSLKSYGFKRRKEIEPFDLLMPRLSAFINLTDFKINDLEKRFRTKIKNASQKGLILEVGTIDNIENFYGFVKNKHSDPIDYYRYFYNIFKKDGNSELLLVKVDYEIYLENAKNKYQEELNRNAEFNEKIKTDPSDKNMNEKMNSDKNIIEFKKDLVEATNGLKNKKYAYIAGAITIKHKNRVTILASGYDPKYKDLNANHFLHNEIIERYKNEYDYLDMGGIGGDFNETSRYYGLDKFKLGFNPEVVEYIGEFDLILNNFAFQGLKGNNSLEAEFLKTKQTIKKDKFDE